MSKTLKKTLDLLYIILLLLYLLLLTIHYKNKLNYSLELQNDNKKVSKTF